MNRERLLHAREVMIQVRDTKKPFDMGGWFDGPPEDCGTAACFFGWCAKDLQFQAEGLSFETNVAKRYTPSFGGKLATPAAAVFFDIPLVHARYLCIPDEYEGFREREQEEGEDAAMAAITPDDVIRHIDDLLEGRLP